MSSTQTDGNQSNKYPLLSIHLYLMIPSFPKKLAFNQTHQEMDRAASRGLKNLANYSKLHQDAWITMQDSWSKKDQR